MAARARADPGLPSLGRGGIRPRAGEASPSMNPRILLWMALLFLAWLNFDAWMKDYGPAARPAAEAPVGAAAGPAGSPQDGLAAELPTITGDAPAVTAAEPAASDTIAGAIDGAGKVRIVTDVLDLELSLAGGELIRADILQYPQHKDDPKKTPVRLFNVDAPATQFLFQSGLTTGEPGRNEPNHKANFTVRAAEFRLPEGSDTLEVPLAWSDGAGLSVTKTFTFRRGSYQAGIGYRVENAGAEPVKLASYVQLLRHSLGNQRSMWDPETYAFRGPAYFDGEKYQKLDIEDEDDAALSRPVTGGWIAAMQHHFVAAAVPVAGQAYQFELRVEDLDYLLRGIGPAHTVPAGGRLEFSETLFVGPKLQEQLKAAGPRLELTADYGMLTILAQPLFWLLSKIYEFVGNWGWTIIIVTFLIKLVFYKLAETSGRSMAKMKTAAPRLKAIQERHKDNRKEQARAMMELYKREKINPVAGCLPVLVQIPFFLAFYWVLLESVEMRQAPFMGWIQDLSARDPFFILPILMGGAMYLQFKLNPAPPDPVQAKVFAFMPVVMTFMFMWFPSGLVLYWLTNTVLSIAQQWRINRVVEAEARKQRGG
ncbi:MAG: membrane protein insertase YidC [Gammaproteobacteria bacterium]|nr:membrane protein insertase YidC [Gammaproteobacteria bacterium]